jgi:glycosyltransferase involved in cell wall biosynthesis
MQPQGPLREIKGRGIFGGLASFAMDKYIGTGFQLRYLQKATSELGTSTYYLHYLETQHSGYLTLRFLNTQKAPIVVGSNWGSDLYWFKRFDRHRKKIVELLKSTDKYLVECERDYELAYELGYEGQKTIVGPNSFTFKPRIDQQKENLIVMKGYQGWAGLSHFVLRALVRANTRLDDFQIIVYSASLKTRIYCEYLQKRFGLNIYVHPKHHFNQDQMLNLFARSSIYIGASRTDGISTSALEAMNQGALPIQTNTSCIGNLIINGVTGFTPSPTEDELYEAVIGALELIRGDNKFINQNVKALRKYASESVARERFLFAYDL